MTSNGPHVGLFASCLVDLYRPSVGVCSVRLLERAGCRVEVPKKQTCCGQPSYNSGLTKDAKSLAKNNIKLFEDFDYLVVPSGSCAAMIRCHYPKLLAGDVRWEDRAAAVAEKTWELSSFLHDVLGIKRLDGRFAGKATYHDSCSGLRELGIKAQPRALLSGIQGLTLIEGEEAQTCCGFGGTFCMSYPDISGQMSAVKSEDIDETGADLLLGGDLGCLLTLAGRLTRDGASVRVRHLAEILAAQTDGPAIGRSKKEDGGG